MFLNPCIDDLLTSGPNPSLVSWMNRFSSYARVRLSMFMPSRGCLLFVAYLQAVLSPQTPFLAANGYALRPITIDIVFGSLYGTDQIDLFHVPGWNLHFLGHGYNKLKVHHGFSFRNTSTCPFLQPYSIQCAKELRMADIRVGLNKSLRCSNFKRHSFSRPPAHSDLRQYVTCLTAW